MKQETSSSEAFESAFDPQKAKTFTTMQGVGFFVFAFTVLVPTFWYVTAGFHGRFDNPKSALLCIVSLGGAATMSIMARKGRRSLSILPGFVMGAGSAGMVIAANTWCRDLLHFPKFGKVFLMFAMLLGTFPGLFVWVRVVAKRDKKNSTGA